MSFQKQPPQPQAYRMARKPAFTNFLLSRLRPSDAALLKPHLREAERAASEQLYSPGQAVELIHFPCGPSLVAFSVGSEEGREVETVLVGREGAVGGIVSAGHLPAYCKIVVKFGGPFLTLRVSVLEEAKARSPALRHLFARYADCLLSQIFQSTACNAVHTIEQRTAKWIIAAMDRTGDHVVPLTHEQVASLLGVGRSYASRVLQSFKGEGVLDTRRGALVVKDFEALRARACLCNESVKGHFDQVFGALYPAESARAG
jgi:hypothetical protein